MVVSVDEHEHRVEIRGLACLWLLPICCLKRLKYHDKMKNEC